MLTLKLRSQYIHDFKIIFFIGFCSSFLFYTFCINSWLDVFGLSSYQYLKPLFLSSKLYEFLKAAVTATPIYPFELSTAVLFAAEADVSHLHYLMSLNENKSPLLMNCDNILMLQTFDFSPYSLSHTISMLFNTVFFSIKNLLYSLFYIIIFYFFYFFFLIQSVFNWLTIGIIEIKILRFAWVHLWYDFSCAYYFSLEYLIFNFIEFGKFMLLSFFFWVPKIFDNFFSLVVAISAFWSIVFAWPNFWFFIDNWSAVGLHLKTSHQENQLTPAFFHHITYRPLSELRISYFLQKALIVFLILFISTLTTDDIDFVKTVFIFGLAVCFFSFRGFIDMLFVIFNFIFCLKTKPGYYWLRTIRLFCSTIFYFLFVIVIITIFKVELFILPNVNFFVLLFMLMFVTVSLVFILDTFFTANEYYYSIKNKARAEHTLLSIARQKLDPFFTFLINTYRQGNFSRYKDYTNLKTFWQHPYFVNAVTSVRLIDMWGYFYNKVPLHRWINISLFFRVYDMFKYLPSKSIHFLYFFQHKFVGLAHALFYHAKFISKLRYIATPFTKIKNRDYNLILSNLTDVHLVKKKFKTPTLPVRNILKSQNFFLNNTPVKLLENLSSLYIKPLQLQFYISKKPSKTWKKLTMFYKNLKKLFKPPIHSKRPIVPENKDKKFFIIFLKNVIKHMVMYRNELISYTNTKIYFKPTVDNKNFYITNYLLRLCNEFLTKTAYIVELFSHDNFDFAMECLTDGCTNQAEKFIFLNANKTSQITTFSKILYKKYKYYALNPDKNVFDKFLLQKNNVILAHTVEELIDTANEFKFGAVEREKQFKTIQRWTFAEDSDFTPEPGKIRYWVCTPKSKTDTKIIQKYYTNYLLENNVLSSESQFLFHRLLNKNLYNNHKLYFDKNLFIVSYGQTHSGHFMQLNKQFYEYTFCNRIMENFNVQSITRNWLKLKSFSLALSYTNLSNHISIVPNLYKLYINQRLKSFLPQNFLLSRTTNIKTIPKQLFFSVNIEIMQQFNITFENNEWNNQVIEFYSDKEEQKRNPTWRNLLKKIDKISWANIDNYELITTAYQRAYFSFYEILASYWESSYYYCNRVAIFTRTYFRLKDLVPENTKSCQYKTKKLNRIIKKTVSLFAGK